MGSKSSAASEFVFVELDITKSISLCKFESSPVFIYSDHLIYVHKKIVLSSFICSKIYIYFLSTQSVNLEFHQVIVPPRLSFQ